MAVEEFFAVKLGVVERQRSLFYNGADIIFLAEVELRNLEKITENPYSPVRHTEDSTGNFDNFPYRLRRKNDLVNHFFSFVRAWIFLTFSKISPDTSARKMIFAPVNEKENGFDTSNPARMLQPRHRRRFPL